MKAIMLVFGIFSSFAGASTFVGNGGNAGDVERLVTTRQITEGFRIISQGPANESLCTCRSVYKNHKICENLKSLSKQQASFCSKFLKKKSSELYHLLKDDNKIIFAWSHTPIMVKDREKIRDADAVTNRNNNTVIIYSNGFLDMNPSERVFLLSHEMFHFTQWRGRPLSDDGAIGPFDSSDGEKKLLNAMAAATVIAAEKNGLFSSYSSTLKRPQGWKERWIDLGFGSWATEENEDNVYHNDEYSSVELRYRHYLFDPLGFQASFQSVGESRTILTSISAEEKLQIIGAGLTYRIFPFSDPLTFWGQSHVVMNFSLEYLTGSYVISDPYVSIEDETNSFGASLEGKYYIPIEIGFWVYAGLGLGYHNYEYEALGAKYESLRTSLILGASYGF